MIFRILFLSFVDKFNRSKIKSEEEQSKFRIKLKNLTEINTQLMLNNKEYKIMINKNATDVIFRLNKPKIDLKSYLVEMYLQYNNYFLNFFIQKPAQKYQ